MITRITLDNFMSHTHTVIEPADGLTVITGPNNCGKSAVVEALRAVTGSIRGTEFVIRHGAKEAAVTIETDDGHAVLWRRRKSSSSYTIDGTRDDRPASEAVEKVRNILRLQVVRAAEGDEPFHIHFGMQKSPIFLLDEPAGRQATFFASSSDAEKLLAMQRLHRASVMDDRKTQNRLDADLAAVDLRLATLAPLQDIREQSELLAAAYQACLSASAAVERASADVDELRRIAAEQLQWQQRHGALADCKSPPLLADELPLAQAIARLTETRRARHRADAAAASMHSIKPPPVPADTAAIEAAIRRLLTVARTHRQSAARVAALDPIPLPPHLQDADELARCVTQLKAASTKQRSIRSQSCTMTEIAPPPVPADDLRLNASVADLKNARNTIERQRRLIAGIIDELAETRQSTAAWVRLHPKCPLCNNPLDAEQLLSGAHPHGEAS